MLEIFDPAAAGSAGPVPTPLMSMAWLVLKTFGKIQLDYSCHAMIAL